MEERIRLLEKQYEHLKEKLAVTLGSELINQARDIKGIKVIAQTVTDLDAKALRILVDQLKNKLGNAVVVLALIKENKVSVVAGVTANVMDKVKANELVNMIAAQIGGKGGGRADLAEGGGNQPGAIAGVLEGVYAWIEGKI